MIYFSNFLCNLLSLARDRDYQLCDVFSAKFCSIWVWNLPLRPHPCWNRPVVFQLVHLLTSSNKDVLFMVFLWPLPRRFCMCRWLSVCLTVWPTRPDRSLTDCGSVLTVVILILPQKTTCWLTNHEIKEYQRTVISTVNGVCVFLCVWVCVCPLVDLWPIWRHVPLSPNDAEIGFSAPDVLIRKKWWLRSVSGQTIRSSDVWPDTALLKRYGGWRIIPESQMWWNKGAESTYCCSADCVQLSGGKGYCLDPRFHFRGFEVCWKCFSKSCKAYFPSLDEKGRCCRSTAEVYSTPSAHGCEELGSRHEGPN